MSAVPDILEQPHPGEENHRSEPASQRRRRTRALGGAIAGGVLAAMLLTGIVPRIAQRHRLTAAAAAVGVTVPSVSVTTVTHDTSASSVSLPGALTAVQTAAIYARTPGYVRRRLVDIGSRVRTGQLLADIDAPDLDQQVSQARGVVAQTRAAQELAQANLVRWRALAIDSAVTAQEVDQMQAAFNEAVANSNSAEANLRRLLQLQGYERVVAPFAGVITARNVDAGALVGTAGGVSGTLTAATGSAPGSLFTVAQTDTLSVYVTVPEDNAAAVTIGKPAVVTVPALPGDTLRGRVARTAGALDATARTLLTEVRVANPTGVFLPGMYAQVQLALGAGTPPLRVPATALVIRDGPPQVVTVGPDSTVRYQTVTLGRDLGSWVEVTGGLADGSVVVVNPADDLRDGARVHIGAGSGTAR
ncbi:MAG: efflux transporter periplasmic adaptor subunit [Gemmatimonadetes bacterium]|nr:MAG: efflux transporter periplasmic adaptor subunit [Gemmatimonadota bacterium]